MPNHVHLMYRGKDNNPEIILGRFKEFTSKKLIKEISINLQESRREWMLPMFKEAGANNSNVRNYQFWQHHNKPIELWSVDVIQQKADYIHDNPVVAGFVDEPCHWRYSSAIDYADGKGLVNICFL